MKNKIFVVNGAVPLETDSVRKYMADIRKSKPLSRADEKKAVQDDNRDALIHSNLKFVVQLAKQYQGLGVPLEDLIAYGNMGLIEAAEKYDESKNFKFITFAVWYIRAYITQAITDTSRTVRIPSSQTKSFEYSAMSTDISINEEEDSESWGDRNLVADSKSPMHHEDFMYVLNAVLNKLPARERDMICAAYGINRDFPESMLSIAKKWDCSEERVRQLIRKTELSIQAMPEARALLSFI